MESEENFADVDDSICPVCRGSTYVGETIRYCTYDVLFCRCTKLIDIIGCGATTTKKHFVIFVF